MRQVIWVVVLSMLCGCSDGSSVNDAGTDGGTDGATKSGPDYASGTRLRAEVYVSADGARQWHGWFDQDLQTDCVVTTAEDGVLRCVPLGAYHSTDTFADSACTVPVATSIPGCDGPPKYALQFGTACASVAYAIGAKIQPPVIWSNQSGCQPATPEPTVDYYRVGAKADPATFVKETRSREARGPELQMQFLLGDDGSKQPNGLFDSARKGACATVPYVQLDSIANRCVPSHVGYAEQAYSDATCTTPAVNIIPPGTCFYAADDVATAAWIYDADACQGAHLSRFAEIGVPQSGPLYRLFQTTCTLDNNPPAQWNTIGAEILPSTFPLLSYSQSGQGRVVDDWYTAASGDKLTVDGFYDTQMNIACDQRHGSDGTLRCIPRALDMTALYLDDQCTSAVYAAPTSTTCTLPPPPTALRVQRPTTCDSRVGYYAVGAKIATPANVWQWNGPTCEPSSVFPLADYYVLTETPPSALAEITDVKE